MWREVAARNRLVPREGDLSVFFCSSLEEVMFIDLVHDREKTCMAVQYNVQ